jgi:hypothetical protein
VFIITREEIITFLIERSHPNPRHWKLTDRGLFANDNRRKIDDIEALIIKIANGDYTPENKGETAHD